MFIIRAVSAAHADGGKILAVDGGGDRGVASPGPPAAVERRKSLLQRTILRSVENAAYESLFLHPSPPTPPPLSSPMSSTPSNLHIVSAFWWRVRSCPPCCGGAREIRSQRAQRDMCVNMMQLVEERAPVASYCWSVGSALLRPAANLGE
mmetsp:Transcript_18763/g.37368  ORF Transcript_18763/g.37368 Transcript_18763/m.37368 type:complete len:150 (-) Transcript_18763:50-499(-)